MVKNIVLKFILVISVGVFIAMPCFAKDMKVGSVDLRLAFYEYEKSKGFDKELNEVTAKKTADRAKLVQIIQGIRGENEFASEEVKKQKQKEMDSAIAQLNDFDKNMRQELLNKKNAMFREVIDDIQKIVTAIGKAEGYDLILDTRNIMYSGEGLDLTSRVIKELNKK
ncbi:Outer membrane chaperone Skp (OmpH) [Candidatus Omnitrophus magneticus]|uniref:Outer membrane chaperone Skp (OmpH) n=1 Tax=Candidatus Omnitrophus magneticus TaxID=1609969 RepID=A0A0F0CQF7_9BACT|nr:Outer membrane chaperone Skp (OmpH) [Candidatus Omnitrophus magneticus]